MSAQTLGPAFGFMWANAICFEGMADGDLERVQKGALRIILGDKYENYKNALEVTKLDSPEDRREKLCLRFAKHEK